MMVGRERWCGPPGRNTPAKADGKARSRLACVPTQKKRDTPHCFDLGMTPCPNADIFVMKLFVNALSAAMNECLNPPQILDPETARKVKDACTVAYARLTEAQILDAIDAAAAKTSQLGIVRFALLERIFDHDGSMPQQCEAASQQLDELTK
jgi:hypothetical protein